MVVQNRAAGDVANVRNVQLVPSHSHVAALFPGKPLPPNMTETWRLASKAIAEPTNAGGEVDGVRCSQLVPSNSHVSLRLTNAEFPPPHRMVRLRVESKVMAPNPRVGGTWLVLTGPQFRGVGAACATTVAPVTPTTATAARAESLRIQRAPMGGRPYTSLGVKSTTFTVVYRVSYP